MPKMHIEKSVHINAPAEKIYPKLNDFNHWSTWSPWLIMEEGVQVDVAPDAKYYSWEGKRVGSGNMKVLKENENQSIDYDLHFLKPWKSQADVRFELKSEGEGTKVTWYMDSSMPWFLFWMVDITQKMVGMDYMRGLNMLKDLIEDGEVHSKLEFKGEHEVQGFKYIGVKSDCAMNQVGPQMKSDLDKLWSYTKGKEDMFAGIPFSIYHKWDMKKDQVSYTSGVPVKEVPADLPDWATSGEIPSTRVYTLRHIGPYLHLGNAWGAMNMMQRGKEFKYNKNIHPFETYVNMPGEVPDNDLITDINFAVK